MQKIERDEPRGDKENKTPPGHGKEIKRREAHYLPSVRTKPGFIVDHGGHKVSALND